MATLGQSDLGKQGWRSPLSEALQNGCLAVTDHPQSDEPRVSGGRRQSHISFFFLTFLTRLQSISAVWLLLIGGWAWITLFEYDCWLVVLMDCTVDFVPIASPPLKQVYRSSRQDLISLLKFGAPKMRSTILKVNGENAAK